ncbi:MAG: cysteine desulfurase family protein [Bacillota bacterium]|jgi:cysteine desulfurase
MQEIYFDNSATTKVAPEAITAAAIAMETDYGNASSLHSKGLAASRRLSQAREVMAAILAVPAREIYFNSCGSEGNNTVLFGIANAYGKRGKKILISAIEHPSVIEPAKILAQRGFTIEEIAVNRKGYVDLSDLEAKLTADTILVSCQQVNNETGAIQPLTEIGLLIKALAKQAFFHIDGVQGFAKLPVDLAAWRADLYTASGHKIHGPKGIGLLWIKGGVRVTPLIYGGGQENNLRSGTENIPAIAAFATAARLAADNRDANALKMKEVRDTLWQELKELVPEAVCNTDLAGNAAPHVLNVSFPQAKSEVLLHYLEAQKIYVSSGSACHSNKNTASHVLLAMGIRKDLADCSLRYSFCPQNTVEEAKTVAVATAQIVKEVRRFSGSKK